MLQEKALRGEDVVVCGEDNVIRYIPAKQVIEAQGDSPPVTPCSWSPAHFSVKKYHFY